MKRSLKSPIGLSIFLIISLWLSINAPAGSTLFSFNAGIEVFAIPDFPIPVIPASWFFTLLVFVITGFSWLLSFQRRKTPLWLMVIFTLAVVLQLLVLLFVGEMFPVTQTLQGSLALSVPLIFGAMAGVLSERVGVINIAIEGQLLAGAFASALIASITGSLTLGLIAAAISGSLVAGILAVFSIKYVVDQIIVGVVVNVLIIGLTSFFYSTVMTRDLVALNQPPRFDRIDIPVLSQIPIIGPLLFSQTVIVYLMYLAVAVVYVALFKTRWGLRLRAVGEFPKAADTVGIKVFRTRYISVMLGGALAGIGGAFFTLGAVGSFSKEMTSGAGYIALAALIFGRWNPLLATLAALMFGFAQNLQSILSITGSDVPSQFLLMLPYALTIVAVAGLVGKVTGPAAAGKAYIKS
jgi:general nucleoside transport system permease protein